MSLLNDYRLHDITLEDLKAGFEAREAIERYSRATLLHTLLCTNKHDCVFFLEEGKPDTWEKPYHKKWLEIERLFNEQCDKLGIPRGRRFVYNNRAGETEPPFLGIVHQQIMLLRDKALQMAVCNFVQNLFKVMEEKT